MKNYSLTRETENALRNYANGFCDAMAHATDNNDKLLVELNAIYTAKAIHYARTNSDTADKFIYDYCLVIINEYWDNLIENIECSLGEYDDLYMEKGGIVCLVPEAIEIIAEPFEAIKDAMESVLSRATNKVITKLPKAILVPDETITTYEEYTASH